MAAQTKAKKRTKASARPASEPPDVGAVLARLERMGSARDREGLARYGITAKKAHGISVGALRALAKQLGPSHELAAALWKSGWYEARLLAAFVDEPERVTPAQMDRWCRDFENWGDTDTVCFCLFDRTPHAFAKVEEWAKREREFEKRAAFALLASLALHDRSAPDARFAKLLPLMERAAADERNFVKKGVLWALRSVGERSSELGKRTVAVAKRLAASEVSSARWVGKSALRELSSAAAKKRAASHARDRSQKTSGSDRE